LELSLDGANQAHQAQVHEPVPEAQSLCWRMEYWTQRQSLEKCPKTEKEEWQGLRDMSTYLPFPRGLQTMDARMRKQWFQ
jgi:hypothetical protein